MACWRFGYGAWRAACLGRLSALAVVLAAHGALGADPLYVVANVSVDATDKDAVAAKAKGTDGTEQNIGGLATHVFERQPDGSLRLRLHTFN